tara:strand:- start:37 stop:240 length:204 start_codon:yes stop_codon:yes gene_type:complete
MRGSEIHAAMLARCAALMERQALTDDESAELEAVAAACEAYEAMAWPVRTPTDAQRRAFRQDQMKSN